MATRSPVPRLQDIVEAIERIRIVTADITLDEFESDSQKRWLVERGGCAPYFIVPGSFLTAALPGTM